MEPNTQTTTETEATTETAAKPALPQHEKVPLTDGRTAIVRRGKGKLSVQANKIAGSPAEIPMALASLMTTIDGEPIIYEDFLELDLADALGIQSAAMRLAGNGIQTVS